MSARPVPCGPLLCVMLIRGFLAAESGTDCPVSETPQIVGVCLVRDEDRFLDVVLRNASVLCDRMMIADNQSNDGTADIAHAWVAADARFSYHRIATPPESQSLIEPYINTPTWIFAVDGDEIYDPAGLSRMRVALRAGHYEHYLRIYGNVLHCVDLDEERGMASGYLSPPSRSMTKLYNFASIREWRGPCTERLHGGHPVLRPEYAAATPYDLHRQHAWDDSPFRCLHTVFLRRSSLQVGDTPRPNIAEQDEYGLLQRLRHGVLRMMGRSVVSSYKHQKYRIGDCVTLDAGVFLNPGGGEAGSGSRRHAGMSAMPGGTRERGL